MREFIRDGIISGDFTNEQKINFTTTYLSKDVITQDDVLLILKSIYPSQFTDETETEHELLAPTLEYIISKADELKHKRDLDELNRIVQTTSMSLSELIFTLATGGDF